MPNKSRRNKGRAGVYNSSDSLRKFRLNQKKEEFMRKMRGKQKKR
jgi:hypothetical protein